MPVHASRLWDKRVRISNLEYRRERLRLGQLRFRPTDAELRVAASASSNCARGGNRFKVVLRKVPLHNLEAFNPASRLHCGELFQMLRCGRREDVSHDSSTGGSARAAQATSGTKQQGLEPCAGGHLSHEHLQRLPRLQHDKQNSSGCKDCACCAAFRLLKASARTNRRASLAGSL